MIVETVSDFEKALLLAHIALTDSIYWDMIGFAGARYFGWQFRTHSARWEGAYGGYTTSSQA